MDIRGTDWCGCTLNHFQHSASSQLGRLLRFVSSCTNHIFNQLHIAWTEYTALRVVDALCTSCAKAALAQSYISCAWFCFPQNPLSSIKISASFERAQNSVCLSHVQSPTLEQAYLTHCLSYLSTFIIYLQLSRQFCSMEWRVCCAHRNRKKIVLP